MTGNPAAITRACAAAASVLAAARAERDGHAATGGPEAVGREAGGTPQQQSLAAALYESLRRRSSQGSAA